MKFTDVPLQVLEALSRFRFLQTILIYDSYAGRADSLIQVVPSNWRELPERRIRALLATTIKTATLNTTYTAPQCKREFSFEAGDAQIFEVSVSLFERRHFYESGLRTSS